MNITMRIGGYSRYLIVFAKQIPDTSTPKKCEAGECGRLANEHF
jgi:hypothetical protein